MNAYGGVGLAYRSCKTLQGDAVMHLLDLPVEAFSEKGVSDLRPPTIARICKFDRHTFQLLALEPPPPMLSLPREWQSIASKLVHFCRKINEKPP